MPDTIPPIRIAEIKARCDDPAPIRRYLEEHGARFVGEDRQVDTYFEGVDGRLKLREGTIENALIHYHRADERGPKTSRVRLYPVTDGPALRAVLAAALGVKVVVDKRREIYFINNVKFHIDRVEGLGAFVEIEALDRDGTRSLDALHAQCAMYLQAFHLSPDALCTGSYSDMLAGADPAGVSELVTS